MESRGLVSLAIGMSLMASTNATPETLPEAMSRLSQWRPAISPGEDAAFIAPPGRIELTTTPDHT